MAMDLEAKNHARPNRLTSARRYPPFAKPSNYDAIGHTSKAVATLLANKTEQLMTRCSLSNRTDLPKDGRAPDVIRHGEPKVSLASSIAI